ncbi:hypothetical protein IT418_03680 [bacterium]|nr:hypothetical protein [bacterium]
MPNRSSELELPNSFTISGNRPEDTRFFTFDHEENTYRYKKTGADGRKIGVITFFNSITDTTTSNFLTLAMQEPRDNIRIVKLPFHGVFSEPESFATYGEIWKYDYQTCLMYFPPVGKPNDRAYYPVRLFPQIGDAAFGITRRGDSTINQHNYSDGKVTEVSSTIAIARIRIERTSN